MEAYPLNLASTGDRQPRKGETMTGNRCFVLILMGVSILFLWTGVLLAGTVIDQDMIDVWGKQSGLTLFYSKKRLRIDQKDGRLSTIMDFSKDRIAILDHGSKSYVAYPFTVWEKEVARKMGINQRQNKRTIRVKPTGAEKTINGFQTQEIHLFIDDRLFQKIWVTQDVDLGNMLETVREAFGRLSGFSKIEMQEKEEIYHKVSERGFPILTYEYQQVGGKNLEEITEVKRIETKKLDNRLFDPPREYTERKP
jgi:hypothetical protein